MQKKDWKTYQLQQNKERRNLYKIFAEELNKAANSRCNVKTGWSWPKR